MLAMGGHGDRPRLPPPPKGTSQVSPNGTAEPTAGPPPSEGRALGQRQSGPQAAGSKSPARTVHITEGTGPSGSSANQGHFRKTMAEMPRQQGEGRKAYRQRIVKQIAQNNKSLHQGATRAGSGGPGTAPARR